MQAEPSMVTQRDRSGVYGARLADERRPAVIIDSASAEVVAANDAGRAALGLMPADRLPYALDSAMPAIATLRTLVLRGLAAEIPSRLMFWKGGRATASFCRVAPTGDPARAHVVVVFQDGAAVSDALPASDADDAAPMGSFVANDDSPPRIIRDDSETLKEIARRIREGQIAAALAASRAAPRVVDHVGEEQFSVVHEMVDARDFAAAAPEDAHCDTTIEVADLPSVVESPQTHAATDVSRKLSAALSPSEIAKLAHELKTPLTAIAAAAEIMRDEQLGAMGNEKYLGYAGDIHSSATHALAVIGDMLAASGADLASTRTAAAIDLTKLANTIVSSLQPLASQQGLALTLDAEPGLTPIRANATAIRQILLNLLTNALKFTPRGGEVRVVTGYLNDGAVFMVVRDTGDGIDAATIAHTFDNGPDRMTQRAGGGRGIGLRLVRQLAAENGAEFEIDCAPGRGTVVMLAFAKDLAAPGDHPSSMARALV